MWGFVIAAPFADMNWHAQFHNGLPFRDQFLTKLLAISYSMPLLSVIGQVGLASDLNSLIGTQVAA